MLEGSTGATQYNLASGLAMGGALQGAGKAISGMDFSKMTNPFSGMFTQAPAASPNSSYWSGNTQPTMRGNYSFGG